MLRLSADDPLLPSLFSREELKGVRRLQTRKRGKRAGSLTTEQLVELGLEERGLVGFSREYQFHPHRKWRFDFAWTQPQLMLAVEIEGIVMRRVNGAWQMGGAHGSIQGFREDAQKYNAASIMGWTVLRYEQSMIKSGELFRDVEQFITHRGILICRPPSIPVPLPASTESSDL